MFAAIFSHLVMQSNTNACASSCENKWDSWIEINIYVS